MESNMVEDSETHTMGGLSPMTISHNKDPSSFVNPFDDFSLNSQFNFNNTQ